MPPLQYTLCPAGDLWVKISPLKGEGWVGMERIDG